MTHRILLAVLVVAFAGFTGAGGQEFENADKTLSPYFLVLSADEALDQLPLLSTTAAVDIAGVIADVRVIQKYKNDGKITVTKYADGELQGPSGVIPVPPDWETALIFDFLDYTGDPADPQTDPALWQFLKTGADGTQLLYGTPLTQQQLNSAQVLGALVDQRRLRAAQRMGAILGRIQTDFRDPPLHDSSVLAGGQVS